MTIGADTALHRIVEAIDAIEQHGRQPPAHLRRRGDGPPLRLSRADGARWPPARTGCSSPSSPPRRDDWAGDVCGSCVPGGRAGGAQASSWSPRARGTATATRSPATTSGSVLEERARRGRAGDDPRPRPARRRARAPSTATWARCSATPPSSELLAATPAREPAAGRRPRQPA